MEKVLGLGGVFFRARDPGALGAWYKDTLGIDLVPSDYETPPWHTKAGITVFAPFPADSDYYPLAQSTMLNFRVADIDAMVTQLRAAGAETSDPETHPNGRFARSHDPEGNAFELWEPQNPS